jgi:RTX calcium-binding nonapeptide repeat (4 copies)
VRTRPYSRRAVAGIALLGVGLLVAVAVVPGTIARFVDGERGQPGTAAAATVVLGSRGTPPTLVFSAVRSGSPRTVNLTIDYRGSAPATVLLRLPSGATTTSCTGSGSTWTDGLLVGSLTLTLGSQSPVSYCSLLDGTARTLVSTVQPNTVTTVPIVATVGGLALLNRTEKAAILVRAVGGFTDQVAGTITITTGAVIALAAAARTAPTPTTAVAAAAPATPPAACVAAGLTTFAEAVPLTADRPRFVAAEDRPGAAGPFLVIGTGGDDTVTGSAAGDCVVGGAGDDTVDGQGGDDVVLGGDGADRIDGGLGNDRLYGEAGLDRLVGGPGADVLDGGADNAACDSDPADTTTACTATVEVTTTPSAAPTPAAVPMSSTPTTVAVPTTTSPVPTTTQPPATTTATAAGPDPAAPAGAPVAEATTTTTTPPPT